MVVLDNVFFGHSLWPFAEGREGILTKMIDTHPSYEVVVCWLVLNVAQSPMQNSTLTSLRMLACGVCLLLQAY